MIEIDKYSRTPIYEQIVNAFEQLIASAELKPNEVLPSVRVLSQKLSINPNTLQKAYAELERKGRATQYRAAAGLSRRTRKARF